jgi:hypothetical protein
MEEPRLYSRCDSCGNVTFSRHGRCMLCGGGKPGEIGQDTPRYFDQRFMTRQQQQRRGNLLLAIFGVAAALMILYVLLILKAHR